MSYTGVTTGVTRSLQQSCPQGYMLKNIARPGQPQEFKCVATPIEGDWWEQLKQWIEQNQGAVLIGAGALVLLAVAAGSKGRR